MTVFPRQEVEKAWTEFQRRGVVHFHALIRLDGPGTDYQPPEVSIDAAGLAEAIRQAATQVRLTVDMPNGPDLVLRRKLRKVCGAGMVLFFITTTGYAFDYILSRETNWYSSIIGFITAVGIGAAGLSW